MTKIIKRLLPVEHYDFQSMQMYFSEMSSKGLHFNELKGDHVYFSEGEARYVRYGIIPVDTKKLWPNPEMDEYYSSFGWEIIGNVYKEYAILRTADKNAVELHTDSDAEKAAHDTVISRIKKNAALSVIFSALVVAAYVYFSLIRKFSVLRLVQRGNDVPVLLLVYPALIIWHIFSVSSQIKKIKLRTDEYDITEIRYIDLWKVRLRRASAYIVSLIIWVLFFSPVSEGYCRQIDNVSYPLPLVSIYDIVPEEDFELMHPDQKVMNGSYSVQIKKSFIADTYEFYQTGYIQSEKNSLAGGIASLRYEVYDIKAEKLTERLLEDVIYDYRLRASSQYEEIDDSRFDLLLYTANDDIQYIIAKKENIILSAFLFIDTEENDSHVRYSLKDKTDLILNALEYERTN